MISDQLQRNYEFVVDRIHKAAQGRNIHLIAVSKTQPVEAIEFLYRLGHRDFGENYAQELCEKADTLKARGCPGIRWHFIGHLQSNKAKTLMPWIDSIHSVDSESIAAEIGKRWDQSGRAGKLPVFLEVNIDQESGKSGIPPSEVKSLARVIAEKHGSELTLQGLMCIPKANETQESTRASFQRLRFLEKSCQPNTHGQLSMGMTHDFEDAIRQGATHIRVGTAIFGSRDSGKGGNYPKVCARSSVG